MDNGPESVTKTPQSSKHQMIISLKLCAVKHLHILVLLSLKPQSHVTLKVTIS
jgi:hypothetical protein